MKVQGVGVSCKIPMGESSDNRVTTNRSSRCMVEQIQGRLAYTLAGEIREMGSRLVESE